VAAEAEIAVHLVTRDRALAERLKLYVRRRPDLRLTVSENLVPQQACDIVLLPARVLLAAVEKGPQLACPCIAWGDAAYLRPAFLAGCSDYLREPWSPEELECRIFRVIEQRPRRGGSGRGQPVVRDMKLTAGSGEVELSYPESLLLDVLLRHQGQVVPRAVLAYALWGKQPSPGSRALDMHICSLRRKLTSLFPDSRISARRGVGYRLAGSLDCPQAVGGDSSSQTTAVP
jgi:DNA-binding winged helix-turn-helix (wHTH) protein